MGDNQDTWPAGQTATMNVTYTQANAAGGAVVCEITPGAGNEFIVMGGSAINSGTHGIGVEVWTAIGGSLLFPMVEIASGAGTKARWNVGLVSTVTGTTDSAAGIGYPTIVSGSQVLRITNTGAGAQNDTFQVLVNIRVKTGQMPTVTHANSTNPANVTATAGAESFTTV